MKPIRHSQHHSPLQGFRNAARRKATPGHRGVIVHRDRRREQRKYACRKGDHR